MATLKLIDKTKQIVCLVSGVSALLVVHSGHARAIFADDKDIGIKPPKNAIVLFDGRDETSWEHSPTKPAQWKIEDGAMVMTPRTGNLFTHSKFENFRLHLEFALADMPNATGQSKSNSGVKLYNIYEIQILDSNNNPTYLGGGCGSIYRQKDPDKNVCRRPGEWQSYDITFYGPKFDDQKALLERPRLSLVWNGVKVHDNVEIIRATSSNNESIPFITSGQIMLQDHGAPVKFRNIWIVPLKRQTKLLEATDPK